MNPALLLIGILSFDFFMRSLLYFLNRSRLFDPLPAIVKNIYRFSSYRRQQLLHRANLDCEWSTQLIVYIISVVLISIGFPGFLDEKLRDLAISSFPRGVVFFALFGLLLQMLKLPCEIIRIFRLENRFGNNKRLKYYLLELFLKGIITLFAGSAAYGLLLVSYAWLNESFWYMSWILFALFFLIYTMINQRITYFFSSKRHASVSDSLRKQLRDLLKDFRLSVKDVLIRKHQPGKQKNPASLTLWGRKGKIMLSEYVLSLLKDDEIKAVIVHEAAHYKRYHILNLLLTTLLQIGLLLFLLGVSLSTPYFQQALGASYQTVYMGLLVFVLLFSPASLIINYFINRLNRHFEYQADEEAKKAGLGSSLAKAIQKLAAEEHVNLSPHPLYVQFYYQHPDLKSRLCKLTENRILD